MIVHSISQNPLKLKGDFSDLWKSIPNLDDLFLVSHSWLLPQRASQRKPSLMIRAGLQNYAQKQFKFGRVGYLKSTLLVLAIIDSVDLYFHSRLGLLHYADFRKSAEVGYRLRQTFAKHIFSKHETEMGNLQFLSRSILKSYNDNKNVFLSSRMGLTVLNACLHCGQQLEPEDKSIVRLLSRSLKESHTVEGFLKRILDTGIWS
jgi:hypothetical protein